MKQEKSINIEVDTMSKLFLMLDRMNGVLLNTQEMLKQQNDKINALSKNIDGLKERVMMINGDITYLEKHLDKRIISFQEKNIQHQKLIEENFKSLIKMGEEKLNVSENNILNKNVDVKNNEQKSIENILNETEKTLKQNKEKSKFVFNNFKTNLNKKSDSTWWKISDPENKNIIDFLKTEREEIVQKFFNKYTEEKITNNLKNTYSFKTIKELILNGVEKTKELNLSKINAHLFFENNQFERLCFQIKGFKNKESVSIIFIFHPFEKKLLKDVELHYGINGMKQNTIFDLYIPHKDKTMIFDEMNNFINTHAF